MNDLTRETKEFLFFQQGPYNAPGMGRPQSAAGYKAVQSKDRYHPGILSNDGAPGNFRQIANNTLAHVRTQVDHNSFYLKNQNPGSFSVATGGHKQFGRMVDHMPLEREVRKDLRFEPDPVRNYSHASNRVLRNPNSAIIFSDQNKSSEAQNFKQESKALLAHRANNVDFASVNSRSVMEKPFLPTNSQSNNLLPISLALSVATNRMTPLLRDALTQRSQSLQPHGVFSDENVVDSVREKSSFASVVSNRSMQQQPHNNLSAISEKVDSLRDKSSYASKLSNRSKMQLPHNIAPTTSDAMRKESDEIVSRANTTGPVLTKQTRFAVDRQLYDKQGMEKEIFAAKPLASKTILAQPNRANLAN